MPVPQFCSRGRCTPLLGLSGPAREMAEEEMVRLWVDERLALGQHARLHVLESAQLCIRSDVQGHLHEHKTARHEERAPYAVEEKQG